MTLMIDSIDIISDDLCFEIQKIIDLFVAIEFNVRANATIFNNQIFLDNYMEHFTNTDEFKIFASEVCGLSKLPKSILHKKLDKILCEYGFYNSVSNVLNDVEDGDIIFLQGVANGYKSNFESYCRSKNSELGLRVIDLIFDNIFRGV